MPSREVYRQSSLGNRRFALTLLPQLQENEGERCHRGPCAVAPQLMSQTIVATAASDTLRMSDHALMLAADLDIQKL